MTALLTAMGANAAPPTSPAASERPRRPIVVRFPDFTCAGWRRLPGLMHKHGCLPAGAARLSRFLSKDADDIDLDGRVSMVDDWTGKEHGGKDLAVYYSNWSKDQARKGLEIPCEPSAFYDDVRCLIAAGLLLRAGKTTKGSPQGYILVISSTAIERLPPNTIGQELAGVFRIDLMAAAFVAPEPEDDDHAVVGGISRDVRENPEALRLDEPVTLAAALTVEGRSEAFAEQLAAQAAAEVALAPRWEHPASSRAARIAAAVRAENAGHDELAAAGLQGLYEGVAAAVAGGCDGDAVDILAGTAMHDALAAVAAVGRSGREKLLDGAVAHQLGATRAAVAALRGAVAASGDTDCPVVAARLLAAHAALDALMAAGLGEALAYRPVRDPDAVVVNPAAYAVAAPEPEVLRPARNRRRPGGRPVDNRPAGRARKTMIQSDSFYPVGQLSLPSGFLPAVTRMRVYQRPDGKAQPKTTPQQAAGPEFTQAELRAGGGFALAIRRRWKATPGLPPTPDVASWTDDGEAVTTAEWAGFVRAITLALQRCDRDHVWLRATEDLMTCFDLVKAASARLWKEIIKPRAQVWPANRAPRRAERYGTSVAAAAADWIADASSVDQDPAEPARARAESVLDGLYADEQHNRIGLWELERDLAQRLAAEQAAESVTPPAVETTRAGRGRVPSRTIRAADDAARAAAAKANRLAVEAARAAAQREQEAQAMYVRWGLDVTRPVPAAVDPDPALNSEQRQDQAHAEADRQRGRRTVADRARAILGEEDSGGDDQR